MCVVWVQKKRKKANKLADAELVKCRVHGEVKQQLAGEGGRLVNLNIIYINEGAKGIAAQAAEGLTD